MLRYVLTLSLTIEVATSVVAQTPSPTPTVAPSARPTTVGTLDAADLRQAIPLIKENYFDPAALSETELNRALLGGLLNALGRSVMLLPARDSTPVSPPAPFYREIMADHIGYLRLGDLSREQLREMDSTLRGLAGKKIDAVILDLRDSADANDFGIAAEFATRFVDKGRPLFALRGPGGKEIRAFRAEQDPIYHGLLIILIDEETGGASETLAACLRAFDRAILIGRKTAGRPLNYVDRPLPSGHILRIAVAQATVPNQPTPSSKSVVPDLPVTQSIDEKHQIFQQGLTKSMSAFVFETDRPHLNEAALLNGTNPEIDAAQAGKRPRVGEASALHDPILQRAVDVVTSIGVYEQQPNSPPPR
jgi:Peptidase family S41